MGYRPKSDAATAEPPPEDAPAPTDELVGGEFTTAGYGIDQITMRAGNRA